MTSVDALMAVKVLLLVAAGVGFVWWQLHDLAQERRRAQELQSQRNDQGNDQGNNKGHEPPGQADT
jgi:predicted negative regulator of RcsB-dependent stress response